MGWDGQGTRQLLGPLPGPTSHYAVEKYVRAEQGQKARHLLRPPKSFPPVQRCRITCSHLLLHRAPYISVMLSDHAWPLLLHSGEQAMCLIPVFPAPSVELGTSLVGGALADVSRMAHDTSGWRLLTVPPRPCSTVSRDTARLHFPSALQLGVDM